MRPRTGDRRTGHETYVKDAEKALGEARINASIRPDLVPLHVGEAIVYALLALRSTIEQQQ